MTSFRHAGLALLCMACRLSCGASVATLSKQDTAAAAASNAPAPLLRREASPVLVDVGGAGNVQVHQEDPLDAENFNPQDYINKQFPNETEDPGANAEGPDDDEAAVLVDVGGDGNVQVHQEDPPDAENFNPQDYINKQFPNETEDPGANAEGPDDDEDSPDDAGSAAQEEDKQQLAREDEFPEAAVGSLVQARPSHLGVRRLSQLEEQNSRSRLDARVQREEREVSADQSRVATEVKKLTQDREHLRSIEEDPDPVQTSKILTAKVAGGRDASAGEMSAEDILEEEQDALVDQSYLVAEQHRLEQDRMRLGFTDLHSDVQESRHQLQRARFTEGETEEDLEKEEAEEHHRKELLVERQQQRKEQWKKEQQREKQWKKEHQRKEQLKKLPVTEEEVEKEHPVHDDEGEIEGGLVEEEDDVHEETEDDAMEHANEDKAKERIWPFNPFSSGSDEVTFTTTSTTTTTFVQRCRSSTNLNCGCSRRRESGLCTSCSRRRTEGYCEVAPE